MGTTNRSDLVNGSLERAGAYISSLPFIKIVLQMSPNVSYKIILLRMQYGMVQSCPLKVGGRNTKKGATGRNDRMAMRRPNLDVVRTIILLWNQMFFEDYVGTPFFNSAFGDAS